MYLFTKSIQLHSLIYMEMMTMMMTAMTVMIAMTMTIIITYMNESVEKDIIMLLNGIYTHRIYLYVHMGMGACNVGCRLGEMFICWLRRYIRISSSQPANQQPSNHLPCRPSIASRNVFGYIRTSYRRCSLLLCSPSAHLMENTRYAHSAAAAAAALYQQNGGLDFKFKL